MQSEIIRSILLSLLVLAASACSKDSGDAKTPQKGLFSSRLLIDHQADDFSASDGDAIPTGLASNKNDVLWACGNITKTGSPDRAIIRQSNDHGGKGTWTIVSDTDGPTHEGATNSAIAADAKGNVYVAQTLITNKLKVASILYYSAALGIWKNTLYETPNLSSSLNSVVVSSTGIPYFTGVTEGASQGKQGFVLTLVDEKPVLLTTYPNGILNQVAVGSGSSYYAVGSNLTGENSPNWFMLSAAFDGKVLPKEMKFGATPVLGNGRSVLTMQPSTYVGGDDGAAWLIKRSVDGVNFTDVDKFSGHFKKVSLTGLYNFANLPFALGGAQDALGGSHWVVRYAEGDGSWRRFLTFKESGDTNIMAKAVGLATIVNGNQVGILGTSYDSKTGYHWKLIRISEHQLSTHH